MVMTKSFVSYLSLYIKWYKFFAFVLNLCGSQLFYLHQFFIPNHRSLRSMSCWSENSKTTTLGTTYLRIFYDIKRLLLNTGIYTYIQDFKSAERYYILIWSAYFLLLMTFYIN
jgi:hypothetical protein